MGTAIEDVIARVAKSLLAEKRPLTCTAVTEDQL